MMESFGKMPRKTLLALALLASPWVWATEGLDGQLIAAAKAGSEARVEFLLDQGADANARTPDRGTPLMCVSVSGHARIARHLLDAGANANLRDSRGRTALMFAASHGHVEVMRALIAAGAELDAQAKGVAGVTALMSAAREGWTACASLLLEAGAHPEVEDEHGRTALDYAWRNRHPDIARLLENAGRKER